MINECITIANASMRTKGKWWVVLAHRPYDSKYYVCNRDNAYNNMYFTTFSDALHYAEKHEHKLKINEQFIIYDDKDVRFR